jgi:hypothetical protein
VTDSARGLWIADLADAGRPEIAGVWETPGADGVAVSGDHAFVVAREALQIVSVADVQVPRRVGSCPAPLARGVAVDGRYAYVCADYNGLRVIDVSRPENPVEAGAFTGPGNVFQAVVAGDFTYVADYCDSFWIVNVAHPRNPRLAARYSSGVLSQVAVAGDLAYLAWGPLEVIDISRPSRPVSAGEWGESSTRADRLALGTGVVYALGREGLSVFGVAEK